MQELNKINRIRMLLKKQYERSNEGMKNISPERLIIAWTSFSWVDVPEAVSESTKVI